MDTNDSFITIQKNILEKIKEAKMIIIHRHVKPDPDAIGSQCGLQEILQASFPDKTIKTAGEVPEDLVFLSTMTPPTDEDYKGALVITVDTANEPRVDDQRYKDGQYLIKIDHHPNDTPYGDLEWVNTHASSCSEMIAEFYLALQDKLVMTDQAARLLYAGIVGDTNRFLYASTTPRTMNIAAKLMAYDFSPADLNDEMTTVTGNIAKLMGHVLETNTVDKESGFSSVVINQDKLNEFGLEATQVHSVVSLPSRVEGSLLWVVFTEQTDGTYRCNLRSKGPIINGIAKKFDGGGHPLASGATVSTQEEIEILSDEMKQLGKQWKQEQANQ